MGLTAGPDAYRAPLLFLQDMAVLWISLLVLVSTATTALFWLLPSLRWLYQTHVLLLLLKGSVNGC